MLSILMMIVSNHTLFISILIASIALDLFSLLLVKMHYTSRVNFPDHNHAIPSVSGTIAEHSAVTLAILGLCYMIFAVIMALIA